jgi:putative DNA primase/helicase
MTAWRAMTPEEIERRKRAVANARPQTTATVHPLPAHALVADSGLPDVALIRGDSVTPRPIHWLWRGWLAAGKFHVLGGQPGTGKTTIALDFAAIVSSGGRWPDGTLAEPGNVLIWSGEDDPEDVLAPRLQAMGADMTRIYFVGSVRRGLDTNPFDPAKDLPVLECKAKTLDGAKLLIVDPVVSAVAGDSHKNAETRRSLQPLVNLAQRLGCAAFGITHLSKGTKGREPTERLTGSLAFGALPRTVMIAFKQSEERHEGSPGRMLMRSKSNIGPDDGGFGYDLVYEELDGFPGIGASRVEWGAPVDGTARELLAKAEDIDEEGGGENAREFLRSLLETGTMRAADVFRDADAHGYSKRQMQRALDAIGGNRDKPQFSGGWEWSLPKMPNAPEDTEDAGQNGVAPSAPSADSIAYRTRRGG